MMGKFHISATYITLLCILPLMFASQGTTLEVNDHMQMRNDFGFGSKSIGEHRHNIQSLISGQMMQTMGSYFSHPKAPSNDGACNKYLKLTDQSICDGAGPDDSPACDNTCQNDRNHYFGFCDYAQDMIEVYGQDRIDNEEDFAIGGNNGSLFASKFASVHRLNDNSDNPINNDHNDLQEDKDNLLLFDAPTGETMVARVLNCFCCTRLQT